MTSQNRACRQDWQVFTGLVIRAAWESAACNRWAGAGSSWHHHIFSNPLLTPQKVTCGQRLSDRGIPYGKAGKR